SCARVVYERIIPPVPLGAQTARPFRANHVNRITSGASALRSAGRLRRRDERLNGAGTAGPKDSTIESSTADGVLVKNWQSGLRSAESRTELKLEVAFCYTETEVLTKRQKKWAVIHVPSAEPPVLRHLAGRRAPSRLGGSVFPERAALSQSGRYSWTYPTTAQTPYRKFESFGLAATAPFRH
ncbi:unnamed protein product, partial [Nesidiocoris tenuis]